MYRNEQGQTKVWLRLVREMGNFGTQARCEEIAQRLNIFKQDGLLAFDYRPEPDTPGQYVLCAKTKVSGDNCPLVLTLMPEDDPYDALREVAGALMPGSPESYQSSGEITVEEPAAIPVEGQL